MSTAIVFTPNASDPPAVGPAGASTTTDPTPWRVCTNPSASSLA